LWVGKEAVNEGLSGVDNKIGSAGDSNSKLAVRKKILNNFIVEDSHNERACKVTESGANAKGTNVGEIVRILWKATK
jgi:hypothetical protein